jgi:propionyl-CoA carboxylase alpha chain
LAQKRVRVKVGERWYNVEVQDTSTSPIEVMVDGETFLVETDGAKPIKPPSRPSPTRPLAENETPAAPSPTASDDRVLRSPMPGKILSITVQTGDSVASGDEVCVIEAMKMHQSIRVSQSGRVTRIHVQPDQQVNTNDPLVEME